MQVGKSWMWLESGAQPHELADPGWLDFIGAISPGKVVVGVDFAYGSDSSAVVTLDGAGRVLGFRPVNPDPRGPDMGQVMTFGRGQQSFLPPTFKPTSTGAGLLDLGTDDPDVAQRAADLRLLRALIDSPEPEASVPGRDAFEEMLAKLEAPDRRFETLTKKQRGWASSVAERAGIDWVTSEDISTRNAAVPRGREVQMSSDVDKRPLAPPGKKQHVELSFGTGHPNVRHVIPVESFTMEDRGRFDDDWVPAEGVESIVGAIPSRAPALPPILEAAQPGPGERTRRPARRPRA